MVNGLRAPTISHQTPPCLVPPSDFPNPHVSDISPLAQLKTLTYVDLQLDPVEDLTLLLELSYLGTVKLSKGQRPLAEEQLPDARFHIVYK